MKGHKSKDKSKKHQKKSEKELKTINLFKNEGPQYWKKIVVGLRESKDTEQKIEKNNKQLNLSRLVRLYLYLVD